MDAKVTNNDSENISLSRAAFLVIVASKPAWGFLLEMP